MIRFLNKSFYICTPLAIDGRQEIWVWEKFIKRQKSFKNKN